MNFNDDFPLCMPASQIGEGVARLGKGVNLVDYGLDEFSVHEFTDLAELAAIRANKEKRIGQTSLF